MEKQHKHKGVERADGSLRLHPVSQIHKDANVKQYHIQALKIPQKATTKKVAVKEKQITLPKLIKAINNVKTAMIQVDNEGFLTLNVDKCNFKGIRLTLTRNRRKVALQFDRIPQ